MKTYAIEINETLSKVIEIEAPTEEEALLNVKNHAILRGFKN